MAKEGNNADRHATKGENYAARYPDPGGKITKHAFMLPDQLT
jgi:hypothetical protein